jgi:hypothetical protein
MRTLSNAAMMGLMVLAPLAVSAQLFAGFALAMASEATGLDRLFL